MKNNFYFSCGAVMLLSMFCIHVMAQTPHIDFAYDAAGNREIRSYSPSRFMDTAKNDPEAEQIAAQYGITVYPNPAGGGDVINVSISSAANSKTTTSPATILLLDNNGKTLLSRQQNIPSIAQVDIKKYPSGVYYVKVTVSSPANKDEQLFYRIVKVD